MTRGIAKVTEVIECNDVTVEQLRKAFDDLPETSPPIKALLCVVPFCGREAAPGLRVCRLHRINGEWDLDEAETE